MITTDPSVSQSVDQPVADSTKMSSGGAIFFCFMLALIPGLILTGLLANSFNISMGTGLLVMLIILIIGCTYGIYYIRSLLIKKTTVLESPILTYPVFPTSNIASPENIILYTKKTIQQVVWSQLIAFILFIIGVILLDKKISLISFIVMTVTLDYFTDVLYGKINGFKYFFFLKRKSQFSAGPTILSFIFLFIWLAILGFTNLLLIGAIILILLVIELISIGISNSIVYVFSKGSHASTQKNPLLIQLITYAVWTVIFFIVVKLDVSFAVLVKNSLQNLWSYIINLSKH